MDDQCAGEPGVGVSSERPGTEQRALSQGRLRAEEGKRMSALSLLKSQDGAYAEWVRVRNAHRRRMSSINNEQ